MTLNFNYKTVHRPDSTPVKTPSIPIVLVGEEKIDTIALIDSGADISAIPEKFAEILGLDIKGKSAPTFGIGGRVNAVDTTMGIQLEKGHEKYSFRIPVKVIFGNYDFPVLLGRAGFFDKFIISFDQSKEKISLKRIIRR